MAILLTYLIPSDEEISKSMETAKQKKKKAGVVASAAASVAPKQQTLLEAFANVMIGVPNAVMI